MFFRSAKKRKSIVAFCETKSTGASEKLSLEILGLSREIAAKLDLNIVAAVPDSFTERFEKYGPNRLINAVSPPQEGYFPEWYTDFMEEVCRNCNPSVLIFPHSNLGLDIAPRLAQRLNGGLVTDARELKVSKKKLLVTKRVEGGIALATFTFNTSPQILTVSSGVGAVSKIDDGFQTETMELDIPFEAAHSHWKTIRSISNDSEDIDLEDAEVVIGGGRGIGGEEGFQLLRQLAVMLNGTVGASRPPCDADWISSSRQIGITGKVINPKLYIPVGISGTSQHLAGLNDCETVLAINKDPKATIFSVADYGIVGDYKAILSKLIDKVNSAKT